LVIAVLVLAVLLSGGVYYHYLQTARYVIALNGHPLFALATRSQGEDVIEQFKRFYAPTVPGVVAFTQGTLAVLPLRQQRMPVTATPQALNTLRGRLSVVMRGYAIFINGVPHVLLASQADALQVLSLAEQAAPGASDGIPTLKERVVVAPYQQVVGKKKLIPPMLPQQAVAELTHPPRRNYYTVKRGDSFTAIATVHGLAITQIKRLNPTLDPGTLQPGDQVRLPDTCAPLTIVVRPM
jgi:hypothetical protein